MYERERELEETAQEAELLAELLNVSEQPAAAEHRPILSREDERQLLREANRAGTPTLAPTEPTDEAPQLGAVLLRLVRRYPVGSLLAGAGLLLLIRRALR